jgi:hypothetical protein
VLGVRFRRDDPGHLRKPAVLHVSAEIAEKRVRATVLVDDRGADLGLVGQWVPWLSVLILMEVQQRVVAVVADIRIIGKAPDPCLVQAEAGVLVDEP